MGGDIYRLFAEVLGRADGCSHGMGGSMHLFAPEVGFWGSVPIVAATIPIAVGAGLACAMDGSGTVAVSYFGDGAVEEGVVHESLNLASQMRLPVLFVCENNLYASHMDISQRQPSDCTARIADAHAVACAVVDGNDVLAVTEAARQLIEAARRGEGPGYLEAVTYRWYGHVGPDENIDVGLRRSASELAAWKNCDPIDRLGAAMVARGDLTETDIAAVETGIVEEIEAAIARAFDAPYPEQDALLDHVYANNAR
jgi:pyruvate dehydrogenase E1 component alpha subunit